MAWDLNCSGYYRGTGMDKRWFRRQESFFGRTFNMEKVVTQGDLLSPTIFNVVVDEVVRAVLPEVYGPQEAQHGFVWAAGEHNI